ncbi:MAG: aldolase [Acidimicrobiia bacterium]|nr:aldolase [Acidimicrobiia bacterium]
MTLLSDDRWRDLLETRATRPEAVAEALAGRRRRPRLTDGRLLLVAADHTARAMLGVRDDPTAMADRRSLLERLLVALAHPGVDGVLGSPDVIEELALLGALDDKLVAGSMNRGGLEGATWELDDPMTAYSAAAIADAGLDAGKVLLRIHWGDAGTRETIVACAQAVCELADRGLMALVEPLPYHSGADGKPTLWFDQIALTRAIGVAAALGNTTAHTWLKVPVTAKIERVLASSTLPALILGGSPGKDPEREYAAWSRAMEVPTVRGLVVGRALLYPLDGDVASAVDRAARIVRPGGS